VAGYHTYFKAAEDSGAQQSIKVECYFVQELNTNPLGDMWKFSLANNSWERVNQGANPPPARWDILQSTFPGRLDDNLRRGANYKDTWQFSMSAQ
jgi:hypothetical protein